MRRCRPQRCIDSAIRKPHEQKDELVGVGRGRARVEAAQTHGAAGPSPRAHVHYVARDLLASRRATTPPTRRRPPEQTLTAASEVTRAVPSGPSVSASGQGGGSKSRKQADRLLAPQLIPQYVHSRRAPGYI